jgi:hypothetical protein
MKIKIGDYIRLKKTRPFAIYEVLGIRSYDIEGAEPVIMLLIWGVNNEESGTARINDVELAIPYWKPSDNIGYTPLKHCEQKEEENLEEIIQ